MQRYDFFIGDKYDPARHDLMSKSNNGRFVLYSEALADKEAIEKELKIKSKSLDEARGKIESFIIVVADQGVALAEKDKEIWVHQAAVQQEIATLKVEKAKDFFASAKIVGELKQEIATLTTKLGENQATLSTLERDYESARNTIIDLRVERGRLRERLQWIADTSRNYATSELHTCGDIMAMAQEALAGKEVDHE